MNRAQRFKFLKIFGDGKPHNWFEVIYLGVISLRIHQKDFERLFKTALAYNLIKGVETPKIAERRIQALEHKSGIFYICSWEDYEYIITPSGDECLRGEQIVRHGDQSYYHDFDRTLTGQNGLDRFAPLPPGTKLL